MPWRTRRPPAPTATLIKRGVSPLDLDVDKTGYALRLAEVGDRALPSPAGRRWSYGATQAKLASSSGSPVPSYAATCG